MSVTTTLRARYIEDHPETAARTLESLPEAELDAIVRTLDSEHLTSALEHMTLARASRVFGRLTPDAQDAVLGLASPRLALTLLDGVAPAERESLLERLPALVADDLRKLQAFEEGTAGRLMDRVTDTIFTHHTVAEVKAILRESALRSARSVYVVDEAHRLTGRLDMQALALARDDDNVREIMEELEVAVSLTSRREEIVELLDRLRVDSVPVVDAEGRLVGVVRYRKLFEAVESLASADLQKMVGASADERALSPAWFAVRRRLPWLHINLLTAFLAAAVVGLFESLIAQFTALAILLPVVAGQSGNAGSQALAVTIRGLALREIGIREWRRVLDKELRVGVIDGLALAVTCGLGVLVWSASIGLALVIGVAMILSMVAAGISGALVPIVLTRMGQDPATASSIILTTVTDVAGFFSFLGTATLLSFML